MKVVTGAALTSVLHVYTVRQYLGNLIAIQVFSQMNIVGSCINCEHDFKWPFAFCILLTIPSELQSTVVVLLFCQACS